MNLYGCYCCGGALLQLLEHTEASATFEENLVRYMKCQTCGTIRKVPPPDQASLRSYYEKAWQYAEPRPLPCWDSAARWLCTGLPASIRNGIDVGGKSLSMFEALGRVGITVEKQSVLDAQPKAGEAMPAWLGQGFVSQHQYDLVVATHILEHAIDPRSFLRDVRLMMISGAHLYIEVPSLEHGASVFQESDDIHPYHLWHYSVTGLAALLWSSGFYALKIESDPSVHGWPCTRVLAVTRQWEVEPFKDMYDTTQFIHEQAALKITEGYKVGDALYGASVSCWSLHEHDKHLRGTLKAMRLYDLHRQGMFKGRFIRPPSKMLEDGTRRVWLTPRFWNSRKEIEKWLKDNYPSIEVLSPYAVNASKDPR